MDIKKILIANSWTDVGVNIQTKAVAKKLSETTEVVFISRARIGKPEIIENGYLKIIEWPTKISKRFKDFLFLIKLIRKEKPDALIVHFAATNLSMMVSWLLRVKFRIAWMHTLSDQYYLDSSNKRLAKQALFFRRQAYRFATNVVVLNEYGKKDAIEQFKIKPNKVYTIYNGINNTECQHEAGGLRKSIRFCGRLDKSKGIDILLKAFSIAYRENKNMILEIAGRGSEEENIKVMVKEANLEDAVKIHGYFYQYNTALKFVSEAYCIVVPSRIDNSPTVILEALSNGVPVIATNTGGIPDMIKNGKEGFLLEAGDIQGIANAINELIKNEALRNEMSEHAIKCFKAKFSMEKHVSNVIDFLQNLDEKH